MQAHEQEKNVEPNTADGAQPAAGIVNILLVDDERRNLDALETILGVPDLRLFRAQGAEDALLALMNHEFACIVLDIQMPVMSGLDLARLIKTRKRNQHIPIIFLTAYYLEERDILHGYGVGAVDYLTKPVNPQILKSKVGVFVELYRTARALAAANASLEFEIGQRKIAEEALRLANIAEQKRSEEAVRRLAAIVDGSDDAIISNDLNGIITSWNESAARLYGYTAEETVGKSISILIPRERQDEDAQFLGSILKGDLVHHFETVRRKKDGSLINVSLTVSPIKDLEGKVVGVSKIARDITQRKRDEMRQLALYELVAAVNRASSLQQVCDAALQAIFQCQRADRASILLCDAAGAMRFTAWRGLSAEYRAAAEGHSPWKPGEDLEPVFVADIDRGQLDEKLRFLVKKEGIFALAFIPITYENRLLGKFMIYFNAPHEFTTEELQPARTIASQIASAIERQRVLQELKKAHEQTLAASRAKDDFLATLSHELRTPLNPILLVASDAALNVKLPDDIRADFEMIRKNVELEARLIDDLLDLTRVTHGKIILEKRLLDLHAALGDAITNVKEEIKQRDLVLTVRLGATNHRVYADGVRLQQVFWNLLQNAIKFTPPQGRITVETESEGQDRVLVKISDTGIGMNQQELSRIFLAFSQGDHAGAEPHRFGGLGLGLAISQKLVQFHSGRICAHSAGRNQGSVFFIELPLASAGEINGSATLPNLPADTSSAPPAKGLRILLVEDHEPTRTALAQLLSRRSYEVATAASFAEARALARQHDFHLLISDIGLPDGSGYDLMAEIGKNSSVRGIALTGYGMEQDLARSQNAGFVAHLTKPIRIQSLETALNAARSAGA